MNKFMTKAALGLTLGATALTAAAPAEAQRYRGGYRNNDRSSTAIVAGIAGLAIGAAIASSANNRYRGGYYQDRGYAYPYQNRGYAYDYQNGGYPYDYNNDYYQQRGFNPNGGYYADQYRGRQACRNERRFDPYSGRSVRVRVCYR